MFFRTRKANKTLFSVQMWENYVHENSHKPPQTPPPSLQQSSPTPSPGKVHLCTLFPPICLWVIHLDSTQPVHSIETSGHEDLVPEHRHTGPRTRWQHIGDGHPLQGVGVVAFTMVEILITSCVKKTFKVLEAIIKARPAKMGITRPLPPFVRHRQ